MTSSSSSISLSTIHSILSPSYETELINRDSVSLRSRDTAAVPSSQQQQHGTDSSQLDESNALLSFSADTIENTYENCHLYLKSHPNAAVAARADSDSEYLLEYSPTETLPIQASSFSDALRKAVQFFDDKRDGFMNDNEHLLDEDDPAALVDDYLDSPETPNAKLLAQARQLEELTLHNASSSSAHNTPAADSENDDEDNVILIDEDDTMDLTLLQQHVLVTQQFFGQDSVEYLPGEMVKIKLSIRHLKHEIEEKYFASTDLSAKQKPISFTVSFPSEYGNWNEWNSAPQVVYKKEDFALEEQLVNISRRYLDERWKMLKECSEGRKHTTQQTTSSSANEDTSEKGTDFESPPINSLVTFAPLLSQSDKRDERLSHLKDELLLLNMTHSQDLHEYNSEYQEIVRKYLLQHKSPEFAAAIALFFSHGNMEKSIKTLREVASSTEYANFYSSELDQQQDMILLSPKSPSETFPNLLLELITYLILRIPNITQTCTICDSVIEHTSILSHHTPTICTNFTCMFQYVEQGVCSSIPMSISPTTILYDLQRNPAVCDLLVTLCYSAAISDRRKILFEPFPQEYVSQGVKNFDAVVDTLKQFPSIDNMVRGINTESELKKRLGPRVYQLLRFVLTFQRRGILPLSEDQSFPEMKTPFQYLLAVDDPQKRQSFQKEKKQFGSYFAFHGTRSECLHSILRRGLVVASGTRLQTTGMIYGAGIYGSPIASTALGFAKQSSASWPQSRFNSGTLQYLILCEISKNPSSGNHVPNPHHVITSSDSICTRMFFIYPHTRSLSVDLWKNKDMEEKIRSILPSH